MVQGLFISLQLLQSDLKPCFGSASTEYVQATFYNALLETDLKYVCATYTIANVWSSTFCQTVFLNEGIQCLCSRIQNIAILSAVSSESATHLLQPSTPTRLLAMKQAVCILGFLSSCLTLVFCIDGLLHQRAEMDRMHALPRSSIADTRLDNLHIKMLSYAVSLVALCALMCSILVDLIHGSAFVYSTSTVVLQASICTLNSITLTLWLLVCTEGAIRRSGSKPRFVMVLQYVLCQLVLLLVCLIAPLSLLYAYVSLSGVLLLQGACAVVLAHQLHKKAVETFQREKQETTERIMHQTKTVTRVSYIMCFLNTTLSSILLYHAFSPTSRSHFAFIPNTAAAIASSCLLCLHLYMYTSHPPHLHRITHFILRCLPFRYRAVPNSSP